MRRELREESLEIKTVSSDVVSCHGVEVGGAGGGGREKVQAGTEEGTRKKSEIERKKKLN